MSDLRALVRELLSEEIAALRAEILGGNAVERVAVGTEAELNDFALNVARRAQEPGFLSALEVGRIRFAPQAGAAAGAGVERVQTLSAPPSPPQPMRLVTTPPASVPEIRKGLVTERDIAAIAEGETRLRIAKTARLTPLAGDEARRRGIRIERTSA